MDDKMVICPLLSIGKDFPVNCLADRCAWYVQAWHLVGEG